MLSVQILLTYGLLGLSTVLNIVIPVSGSAMVTPLLAMITDPHRAIGIASFFFFLSALARVFFFRENIQWHEIKVLLIPSVVAAFFGALALVVIPTYWLLIIILIFSIYFLLKKLHVVPNLKRSSQLFDHAIGLISGFLQGTGLAGSDLRNQYLYARNLNLADVHGTSSLIGGSNFLVATIVRLYTEQLTLPDVTPLFYLFPVIIIATWLGKKVLFKLPQKISNSIVIGIMIVVILSLTYEILVK